MASRLHAGEVECVAGKTELFDWTLRLYTEAGARIGLESGDVVQFKLATTQGGAAVLTVTTSATANGSVITVTDNGSSSADAVGTLKLTGADTTALSGNRYFELNVLVHADSDHPMQPLRGVMKFLPSMT